MTMNAQRSLPTADELRSYWRESPRWRGIKRDYSADEVVRLRGTVPVEYSIARLTAEKLWRYVNEKPFVNALGALTGNQAMQQVKAGLDAIYLSGWQVAGDANLAGPVAVSGGFRAGHRAQHQQHAAPRGPDPSRRGR
jgi:isocitrate lyase